MRPDRGRTDAPGSVPTVASLGPWIWVLTGGLVALWLFGMTFNVGGDAVHLLLVIAVALLGYELFMLEKEVR